MKICRDIEKTDIVGNVAMLLAEYDRVLGKKSRNVEINYVYVVECESNLIHLNGYTDCEFGEKHENGKKYKVENRRKTYNLNFITFRHFSDRGSV